MSRIRLQPYTTQNMVQPMYYSPVYIYTAKKLEIISKYYTRNKSKSLHFKHKCTDILPASVLSSSSSHLFLLSVSSSSPSSQTACLLVTICAYPTKMERHMELQVVQWRSQQQKRWCKLPYHKGFGPKIPILLLTTFWQ